MLPRGDTGDDVNFFILTPQNALNCQALCIYTHKSREEGLDQEFNSLDAQRQAGVDCIRS